VFNFGTCQISSLLRHGSVTFEDRISTCCDEDDFFKDHGKEQMVEDVGILTSPPTAVPARHLRGLLVEKVCPSSQHGTSGVL